MRSASRRASAAHSSSVMPETGMSGRTSVAPMRGCAPLWRRMSISSDARFTPAKAASTTSSGAPTKVTTVRFVASPGSTSRTFTPPAPSIASTIRRITSLSRPSLKLGTHSTIRFSISYAVFGFSASNITNFRNNSDKIVTKKASGAKNRKSGPEGPDRETQPEAPDQRRRRGRLPERTETPTVRRSAPRPPYTRSPAAGYLPDRSSACR